MNLHILQLNLHGPAGAPTTTPVDLPGPLGRSKCDRATAFSQILMVANRKPQGRFVYCLVCFFCQSICLRLPRMSSLPTNLGKPSLRRRLEAYYQKVSPDQTANPEDWKDRFDKIWQKFGGTIEGEQKLAVKLEKKYGSMVRLAIVTTTQNAAPVFQAARVPPSMVHEEAFFELSEQQQNSGILSFDHVHFDPLAALASTRQAVELANHPWLAQQSQIMERVDQCKSILPHGDPLYQPVLPKRAAAPPKPRPPKYKAPPAFRALAEMNKDGPTSLLYQSMVQHKRIRVLVRYLNGIRGTLTGHVLAFDKHFNLLLQNVHEVYSPRQAVVSGQSRTEQEVQRRLQGYNAGNNSSELPWTCRQRHLRQIMVRGDVVVLIYRPDQEQSCWPLTAKSPKHTIYRSVSIGKVRVPVEQRVGSPGSFHLVVSKQKQQQQPAATHEVASLKADD